MTGCKSEQEKRRNDGQRQKTKMQHYALGLLRGTLPLAAAATALCMSDTAAEGVRAGLALCTQSVIPALFVFLVLSPMIEYSLRGLLSCVFGSRLDARIAALASALAIGMTAGFPIGAAVLVSQYRQGVLSANDTQRFLGVCTGASPAFLIGYFGIALWGSAELGLVMWCMQCVLCFAGFLLLLRRPVVGGTITAAAEQAMPQLSDCLREAVGRMLSICGAVVFFSVLRAVFCRILPPYPAMVLGGAAEMTGGLRECAVFCENDMLGRREALVVSAAMIGFGGFCVGMQTADIAHTAGIALRQYRIQRMLLGAAMALCGGTIGTVILG